jgi:imidazolonepropionase-like amidohydrolase
MKKYLWIISIFAFVFSLSILTSAQSAAKVYRFTNGNWFDGKTFKKQTMYSINGVFASKKPAKIDEIIDLKNQFVIPPLADAHCHHFDGAYNVDQQVGMYLKDGVFYAKVQTDVRSGALEVKNKVNQPNSVDVSYSHGALTHTYGHGIEIYESLALGYYGDLKLYEAKIPQIAASRIRENDAYYIIDTAQDLENKWQKILDGKPDFIKIYLLTGEDFEEKRKNIPNIPLGSIGLDPKLVPAIVQKAHAAGLRVSAHVDTAFDFRTALNGGVDEMAHIPGYYVDSKDNLEKYLLTEKDVRETVRRKVWVVPAPIFNGQIDEKSREKTDVGLKANLNLLKKFKAKIAFGSDRYGNTPIDDVFYLQKLGVFSNLELLKIWSEDTPQTIFPNRRIGKLKDGYEASFITAAENPLTNFETIKNIKLRFKQGIFIELKK